MKKDWASELGCTEYQVLAVAEMFVKTLKQIARLSDEDEGELVVAMDTLSMATGGGNQETKDKNTCSTDSSDQKTAQRPLCSATGVKGGPNKNSSEEIKTKHAVLDCYQASVNALRTGVGIANMVLNIENFVQDTN